MNLPIGIAVFNVLGMVLLIVLIVNSSLSDLKEAYYWRDTENLVPWIILVITLITQVLLLVTLVK